MTSQPPSAGPPPVADAPKALSVRQDGQPDGFVPPDVYTPQVLQGGYSRLRISCAPSRLPALHQELVALLQPPLKVLYVQLTDRATGQLPQPRQLVGVDLERDLVLGALAQLRTLVYEDGRHQLWVKGAGKGEQVVLEELGVVYAYPDDPASREVCERHGLRADPAGKVPTMAERDYVMVSFRSEADSEEMRLIWTLGLQEWRG